MFLLLDANYKNYVIFSFFGEKNCTDCDLSPVGDSWPKPAATERGTPPPTDLSSHPPRIFARGITQHKRTVRFKYTLIWFGRPRTKTCIFNTFLKGIYNLLKKYSELRGNR